MKSHTKRLGVAVTALAVVMLAAAPALAAPDFSGTPTLGNVDLDVAFTPIAGTWTGVDSTTWDFGDGTTVVEPAGAPSVQNHTYTAPGLYDVTMIVWYTASDDSVVTKLDYIEVASQDFVGTPRLGTVPLTVTFSAIGADDADSIQWVFGDGDDLWDFAPYGVAHSYNSGPTTFTVEMHAWYGADDSTATKADYIETVAASIVYDSTNSATCGGTADSTLPDTAYFTYYTPPAVTNVWFYVRYDTTTGNVPFDSMLVTASAFTPFSYVFTTGDDFWVKAVPYNADSTWTASVDSVMYTSHDCYCVRLVNDGYDTDENTALQEFVLDNDTLGVFNDPQAIDTIWVDATWKNHNTLDTAFFDTTDAGEWRINLVPTANWHGKDSVVYWLTLEEGCTDSSSAVVYFTVFSDNIVGIDSLWYDWTNVCMAACETEPTISLGDQMILWVKINPVDVQEIAGGWPKVWYQPFGGSPSGDVMFLDTTGVYGDDSTYYSIPIQDAETAWPDSFYISGGDAIASPGFLEIYAQIMSTAGYSSYDTTTIEERVDTRAPDAVGNDSISVVLWKDLNDNGIINKDDTLRMFIDLRNNPINDATYLGGDKEICSVVATLFGWRSTTDTLDLTLTDLANDNRFYFDYKVDAGVLDSVISGSADLDVQFVVTDNACNVDTVWTTVEGADAIDIISPDADSMAVFFEYRQPPFGDHGDLDSNGCLRVGEYVQVRVEVPRNFDADSMYVDLVGAGIAYDHRTTAWRQAMTLGGDNISDTTWWLVWKLEGTYLDSIVNPRTGDTIPATVDAGVACGEDPNMPMVHITVVDEAGNSDTVWSGPLDYDCIDTDIPTSIPADSVSCARYPVPGDSTFDVIELTWTYQDSDAAFFEIYWNDDMNRPIDTITLAAQFEEGTMVWRSDSTVHPVSPCRDYNFKIVTVDNCYNRDFFPPTITCEGEEPLPITNLQCRPDSCGGIQLEWDTDGYFGVIEIYWNNGVGFLDTLSGPLARFVPGFDPDFPDTAFSTWDEARGRTLISVSPSFSPPLNPAKTYYFSLRGIDTCSQSLIWSDTVQCSPEYPDTVTNLAASCDVPIDSAGHIKLTWKRPADPVGGIHPSHEYTYYIYMGKDGVIDYSNAVDTIVSTASNLTWYTWEAGLTTGEPDSGADIVFDGWYDFAVSVEDACGWPQEEDIDATATVKALSDKGAPYACIMQPDTIVCNPNGISVYVCAADPAEEYDDIDQVEVWVRNVADDNWTSKARKAGTAVSTGSGETCFEVQLNTSAFDQEVGGQVGNSGDLEMIVVAYDDCGKASNRDSAYALCPPYKFSWSVRALDAEITSVNGNVRVFHEYCQEHGYEVFGPSNELALEVTGEGDPPYKVRVWVDGTEIYYTEESDGQDLVNIDATGLAKGHHSLSVAWSDLCGRTAADDDNLCVPDSLAPCAEIVNPVDGKCVRKSRSMLDSIPVTLGINPDANCLDPDSILKVDFEWALECCDYGDTRCTTYTYAIKAPATGEYDPDSCIATYRTDPFWGQMIDTLFCGIHTGAQDSCTFYYTSDEGYEWQFDSLVTIDTLVLDSFVCAGQSEFDFKVTFADTQICLPCDQFADWTVFSIESGDNISDGLLTTKWYNRDVIDEHGLGDGDLLYLRARIFDEIGNVDTTRCVAVCIDTTTPPLVLWTPDVCMENDVAKLNGTVTMIANLDLAPDYYDDIESVELFYKKSTDPDLYSAWTSAGAGAFAANGATRETGWKWSISTTGLVQKVYYDFRVIAKTIHGLYSYDFDGDTHFDAGTFDVTNGDAATWFIDNSAPNIAFDTVETVIDDIHVGATETVIQPNVSCAMSDPRGYIWSQYGKPITVHSPAVYPADERGDIVRVEYSLWDGDCANCGCVASGGGYPQHGEVSGQVDKSEPAEDCGHKVLAILEGDNALDAVTLDPLVAPFISIQDGYQTHVLHIRAWDGCGNMTEDCVTWYMLDIDPSEAIVITPKTDSVICQDHSVDGGIQLEAATLLGENFAKSIWYYRAVGGEDWIPFDSTSTLNATWYPHALGLADGQYELNVVVEDAALNRSELKDEYATTVFLSCAAPEVTLLTDLEGWPETFFGCSFELQAEATAGDYDQIRNVEFFITSITGDTASATSIGVDDYQIGDDIFGYFWRQEDIDYEGDYYIFAVATTRGGLKAMSELVKFTFDGTPPKANIIQVGSDLNIGDSQNPTVLESGQSYDVWALVADNESPGGVGADDNCGVDSVIIYASYIDGDDEIVVWGEMMTDDPTVEGRYSATWDLTSGIFTEGVRDYKVYVKAWDCACNDYKSTTWWVRVVNPMPEGAIAVTPSVVNCDYWSTNADEITLSFTPFDNVEIEEEGLTFWYESALKSDVADQYKEVPAGGDLNYDAETNTWSTNPWRIDTLLAEGLYRVRAVYQYQINGFDTTITSDDADASTWFDDFSFDPDNKPYHMYLMVDRSATDFTMSLDAYTIEAGTDVTVTVDPAEECDAAEICYGALARNDSLGAFNACVPGLEYSFDPIDSGLVSLEHGWWNGPVAVQVSDALGNSRLKLTTDDLYVLSEEAMVVYPGWADYITSSPMTLRARKWASSDISEMNFFYGDPSGAGTQIDGDVTQAGDEFMISWDLEDMEVTDGPTYIWAEGGGVKTRAVPVTVALTLTNITLNVTDATSYVRTVNNEDFTFVGGLADFCLDRDSISAIVNNIGIDSVVFCYRSGDAPGVPNQPDPELGWVWFETDRYGSLCADWNTQLIPGLCTDGRYAVAAWVFDKAGNVNHSNLVHVMVDNTDPYSEIVDIDGDETFEDCHVLGDATPVTFTAVAIDDRSCAGDEPYYNSGAKYLQFFVGDCSDPNIKADIVWVIDGSGSMANDQLAIAAHAQYFFDALGDADFQVGVVGFGSTASPINTAGQKVTNGVFTTNATYFSNMVAGVGTEEDGKEYGLTAIKKALDAYPWRSDASKIIILVTDEEADDADQESAILPQILLSDATVHSVLCLSGECGAEDVAPAVAGYENLDQTGGVTLDISSAGWGANLAALAEQIAAGAGSDAGIIWGEQVTLEDGQDDAYALWDPSGVGVGTYCAWTVVIDQLGNRTNSGKRYVCITDTEPPVGHIAGFGYGHSCCDSSYAIYGRTCAEDVAWVQFQYRDENSDNPADWRGIGTPAKVKHEDKLWMTWWNPCDHPGDYELRMVPTDEAGNEDFSIQPITHIHVEDCEISPTGASVSTATVSFEDKRFRDDLGLVDVNGATMPVECHTMVAVYADFENKLDADAFTLQQDLSSPSHYMGSFDNWLVKKGGFGWFWIGQTDYSSDPPTTKLAHGDLTVYPVDEEVGFPGTVTDDMLGAVVTIGLDALTKDNGVVIFPARVPIEAITQSYMQYYPNKHGDVTSIRLTKAVDEFNVGTWATVTITYDEDAVADAGKDSTDLVVGWWDGDEWNTVDGMQAGPPIGSGEATFYTKNLHGIYAVLSAGRDCTSGAIEVAHYSASPENNGAVSPDGLVIKTLVRSKVHQNDGNYDIDPSLITVRLDGVTIYSRGDNAEGWLTYWDNTSGILTSRQLATDNIDDFFYDMVDAYGCGDVYDRNDGYDMCDYLGYNSEEGWYNYDCDPNNAGQSPSLCCRLSEYLRNYYDCTNGHPTYNGNYPQMDLACGNHTYEVEGFNRAGYCDDDTWNFTVDCTPPDVHMVTDHVCPNPTFTFTVSDDAAGVDWEHVYVDVFEVTPGQEGPGEFTNGLRKSRWLHTEVPDAWDRTGSEVTFSLTLEEREWYGFQVVIYDGTRYEDHREDCDCVYYTYSNAGHGVPDMVGNHTQVYYEFFTVSSWDCEGGGVDEKISPSNNPFNPADGAVDFQIGGWAARGAQVTAKVYDLTGELVKSLNTSGPTVSWDGTNSDGVPVAAGVYLVHFHQVGAQVSGTQSSQVIKLVLGRAD
jgi:hypothetical protein